MATYPLAIGAFEREADAKQAIDALHSAGFSRDQIGVAMREGGATRSLLDDLQRFGVSEEEARYYDNEFQANRTVISVRGDGREQEAWNILRQAGAYSYNDQTSGSSTAYASTTDTTDYSNQSYAQPTATTTDYAQTGYSQQGTYDTTADTDEERRLKLHEEQLNVNKERVQTGEARLRKDVVEEQQSVDVPVTREEVYIERRPGSGQVSDTPVSEDETIRVPVSEEQVNVNKQTVETGEVAIGKRAVQDTQTVSDTVRREEAHLEREGDTNIRNDDQRNSY